MVKGGSKVAAKDVAMVMVAAPNNCRKIRGWAVYRTLLVAFTRTFY